MLDKELCKKCVNKYAQEEDKKLNEWNVSRGNFGFFSEAFNDDEIWERGKVACVYRDWRVIDIDKDAPRNCPFLLEHIMKEDENARQKDAG